MKKVKNTQLIKSLIFLFPLFYSIFRVYHNPLYFIGIFLFLIFIIITIYQKLKNIIFLGSLSFSYIFLDWTFSGVDFSKIPYIITQISWLKIVLFVSCCLVASFMRAIKWRYILHSIKPIRISRLFSMVMIGFWGNVVFPAKIGELIKVYFLGEKEKIKKSSVLATVILDRIFDGLFTLLLVGVAFILLQNKIALFKGAIYISTAIYLSIFIILIFIFFRINWFKKVILLFRPILPRKWIKKFLSIIDSFCAGLHILHNIKNLAGTILFSCVMWAFVIAGYYFALDSLNIGEILLHDFSFPLLYGAIILTISINLAVSIPAAPGGAGPYHAFILYGLSLLNPVILKENSSEHTLVALFSLILWIFQIGTSVTVGLLCLYKERLPIHFIKKKLFNKKRKN